MAKHKYRERLAKAAQGSQDELSKAIDDEMRQLLVYLEEQSVLSQE